jgi:hypothetical protein
MAPRTWKCVPCQKTFQSTLPATRDPHCPRCGKPLTLLAPPKPRLPIPQPRTARPKAPAPAAKTAASTRCRNEPVETLSAVASSAWVPDPEPAPSPDGAAFITPPRYAPGLMDPVEPPTLLRSPWFWTSCFAVALTLTFFIVFLVYRQGRTTPIAAAASIPTPSNPTPSNPAAGQPQTTAPVPATLASATLPSSEQAAPRPSGVVNLLPLIDLARDVRNGNWHVENGSALVSDASGRARIAIRYQPPREYDFLIQFTQVSGNNCVTQIFSVDRHVANFVLGGWQRKHSGFQHINGKAGDKNPSTVHGPALVNGQRHTCVIQVRKQMIQAVLDGQVITSYQTDGSDLAQRDWDIGQPLGIGSHETPTIFHKVELIPVDSK